MLNGFIKLSLKNRYLVIGLIVFAIVYGLICLQKLSVDVFPDLTKPTITVITEVPGRAPEEVETLVTVPLEFNLLGLPQMQRVRSTSGIGISVIYLEFDWDTDIYWARQLVAERLAQVKETLPKDVSPMMGPVSSIMGQIQQIAMHSPQNTVSPMELRTYAEWVVRPRLLKTAGVAQVLVLGGELKQYQILLSADKLNQYQISLEDIDHNLNKISKNTSGGFIEAREQEFMVRNIGALYDVEDIENTVIAQHFGNPIFIKDIAEVKISPQVKRGDASFMAKPSVILVIQKQPGASTIHITDSIEQTVKDLKNVLPEDLSIATDVFRQSEFIVKSIEGVIGKLQLGTVLVFAVLLIFMAHLRMSLITLMAIPLSFFITFMVFRIMGLSINTMTLGGLAIAIGELVDDSIVDVENIYRRLKENAKLASPQSFLRVIYEASAEVRNSIVLSTIIVALVFLPLFQLQGLEGSLFSPLAVAYLSALFASLLISLTVTPVLSSFLLRSTETPKKQQHQDTPLVKRLKAWDEKILKKIIHHPKIILGVCGGLFISSVSLLFFIGSDFLPKFNEGTAMVSLISAPGTSLTQSSEVGRLAEQRILQVPEVRSVSRRTGRSERDEHAMGVNVSELDVDFKKEASALSRDQALQSIREVLGDIPNVVVNVGQPIAHLMDHALSGVSAQIAIKIFGEDLDVLRLKASELKELIADTPGLVDLSIEQQALVPQLKIHVLQEEAAKYNLSSGEVTALLEPALNGVSVGTIIEDQKFFDLIYRFSDDFRGSQEGIEKTQLKLMPNGQRVLVEDVADVYQTQGPNEIHREDGLRRIVISANVHDKDLGSVVSEIQQRIDSKLELPEDYFVTYGGQFVSQAQAQKKLLGFGVLALLGAAFVLWVHFQSSVLVLQIMLTLPLAFIGGIWALFLSGQSLTVASLIGFITLIGIASRNAIMMVSHYLHLMKHEGEDFNLPMVIRGSLERLTPVLMTASVTSLALVPIVFSAGKPGSEILQPVAIVVVGGLISSTLLDILVTPTLFWSFGKTAALKSISADKAKDDL